MTKKVVQSISKENEMMVLGCMLTSNDHLKIASSSLSKDNFYYAHHKDIFLSLQAIFNDGQPVDVHILCEHLKNKNKLDSIGGVLYLVTLAQYVGTLAHIEYYVDQLIDDSTKRNLHKLLIESNEKSAEEIKSILLRELDQSIEKKASLSHIFQYLLNPSCEGDIIEEMQKTSSGVDIGMKIGNHNIELPGGAITIVAAPTSHGKTTMLINQALGVLKNNPKLSVYFFSYEESMSAITACFLNTFIGKEISKNNRRSIESFFKEGRDIHIKEELRSEFIRDKNTFFTHFIETGRLNISYSDMSAEQLVKAIKYIKKNKKDVGAIFIDYMQLLMTSTSGKLSRQEQLKTICLMLKDCAIETGLPLVLGAQFNRQVTCEADLSPIYISEAGDIERIASLILGFWNRNFLGFSREGNKTKKGDLISEPRNEIYIEVLKGRKIGSGHNSVFAFNGNIGEIKNKPVIATRELLFS